MVEMHMFDAATLTSILIWGLAIGCIYVLLATGLNLIFGVMKLVNFAHGELLMIGAYVSYSVTTAFGLNVYLSVLVSMAVVALVGLGVERLAFRRVLGADKLNEILFLITLLLWFGVKAQNGFPARFRT
jgi:branched-chain amino acid transport system permease protein